MTVRDLIDDGGKLAPMLALQAGTEDLSNLVGCQAPQAEFAASLEQFVNWKVAFEYDVVAILDLTDGVNARQLDELAFLGGEFRAKDEGPVVTVSRRRQWRHAVREMKGRPFGTALQGEVSNSHKLLQSKAAVVNVMVKRRG